MCIIFLYIPKTKFPRKFIKWIGLGNNEDLKVHTYGDLELPLTLLP
jgi:hypothetical protein